MQNSVIYIEKLIDFEVFILFSMPIAKCYRKVLCLILQLSKKPYEMVPRTVFPEML